ncbi:MAG: DUF4912 domain-containing protein [Clostridia bacterium]|nr:DUF4912 domain-containing protein [Clostridia bacterium]
MLHNKSEYYELPIKYDETVVRLLVQSPKRMYVYWDISDQTIQEFSKKYFDYAKSTPILRIINLTKNYFYDIPIDPFANNYYIDVEDENCEYEVELGRTFHDKFADIYMSNHVTIPNSTPLPFENENEEILFKNYICLDTKKMRVNIPKQRLRQDYGDLPFGIEDNISSNSMK